MGHNVSDRKRRAFLLFAGLTDLRDWTLSVEYARCRHQRMIAIAHLLTAYRGDIRVQELLPRLRCSQPHCRAHPGKVVIARIVEAVILIGPGAYS